mgnify:CR=1 FL=1
MSGKTTRTPSQTDEGGADVSEHNSGVRHKRAESWAWVYLAVFGGEDKKREEERKEDEPNVL